MVTTARLFWTTLGLLTTLALTITPPATAQLQKAGVVTTLQGTASVARATLPQPAPLKFKDDVYGRDRITTGDDSVARILLGGKAIVTVRERSSLSISESAATSAIDLGVGRMALAVAKERMKPGESIEIRTPNAVAGIRGTVVITEVTQATSQVTPGPGAFTTVITVITGAIDLRPRDPVTGRLGAAIRLGALETSRITGGAPPTPPQRLTPEAGKQKAEEFKTKVKEEALGDGLKGGQLKNASDFAGSIVGGDKPGAPELGKGGKDKDSPKILGSGFGGGSSSGGGFSIGGGAIGGGGGGGGGSTAGGGGGGGGGGISGGGGGSRGPGLVSGDTLKGSSLKKKK